MPGIDACGAWCPAQVTHLFRDVLHGWGRVLLVTNVSASAADYDETLAVLKYAVQSRRLLSSLNASSPWRLPGLGLGLGLG
jgi:hypothetical protein